MKCILSWSTFGLCSAVLLVAASCGDGANINDASEADAPADSAIDAALDASIDAAPPQTAWSRRFGGMWNDVAFGVGTSGLDTVWIAGAFCSPDLTEDVSGCLVNLGGGDLTVQNGDGGAGGGQDIFVAHYAADGSHQFSAGYTSTFAPTATSVTVDGNSLPTVVGSGFGGLDFGGGALTSGTYAAGLSTSGTHRWSAAYGALANPRITSDSANNIYIAASHGTFASLADFGGGQLSHQSGCSSPWTGCQDIVIAKLASDGQHAWSRTYGATGGDDRYDDAAQAIAIDNASGAVYATGFFGANGGDVANPDATIDFGEGGLTASSELGDIFVIKLDANGTLVWSRRFGGNEDDKATAAVVDGNGDLIIGGQFRGAMNLGGGTLTSAGNFDGFVAKFSGSDGSHLWSFRIGDDLVDQVVDLEVTSDGNILVAGDFTGDVDFGGGVVASQSDSVDVFLALYDTSGSHIWGQRYGGTGVDNIEAVAIDSSGNYIGVGSFEGTTDFGTGLLTSSGRRDIFVFKVDPAP